MPPHSLPKSEWGPGPWQREPDQADWEFNGYACAAVRNMHATGAWCGYVGVTAAHPFFGKFYGECALDCAPPPPFEPKPGDLFYESTKALQKITERFGPHWDCKHTPESVLSAHGGITFGGPFPLSAVPRPEWADLWWFGFDCAHANDVSPAMDALMRRLGIGDALSGLNERVSVLWQRRYRSLGYVKAEVNQMVAQIATVADVALLRSRS